MKVCCPGSFDPITYGHLDVIERAAQIFDEVVVAVGQNTTKNYIFSPEERIRLVRQTTEQMTNVEVKPLTGLLVEFCRENNASAIIKGLRFSTDFDYELQIAHVNRSLSGIETILLPAGRDFGTISSTIVREVAINGGDISSFVPPAVIEAVQRTFTERQC